MAAVVVNFVDLAVQVEQGFVEDFELFIGQFIVKLFVLNPNVQRRRSIDLQNPDFVLSEGLGAFLIEFLDFPLEIFHDGFDGL